MGARFSLALILAVFALAAWGFGPPAQSGAVVSMYEGMAAAGGCSRMLADTLPSALHCNARDASMASSSESAGSHASPAFRWFRWS